MIELNVLCAGAAKGLVTAMQESFSTDTGAGLRARFGAVGAMKEALLAGQPCDVLVVTAPMVDSLAGSGELRAKTRADLGRVHTGVAVRAGALLPDITTGAALRAALLAADALYCPDPQRATAGIHFADVMRRLGVHDELAPRFRAFADGATAMQELSQAGTLLSLGCTQITEIRYTDGVRLVGPLPAEFELATIYAAAVTQACTQQELASRFIALLAGPASRALREAGGFEFAAWREQ